MTSTDSLCLKHNCGSAHGGRTSLSFYLLYHLILVLNLIYGFQILVRTVRNPFNMKDTGGFSVNCSAPKWPTYRSTTYCISLNSQLLTLSINNSSWNRLRGGQTNMLKTRKHMFSAHIFLTSIPHWEFQYVLLRLKDFELMVSQIFHMCLSFSFMTCRK